MARWCHLPVGTLVTWEGSYQTREYARPFLIIEQHVNGLSYQYRIMNVVTGRKESTHLQYLKRMKNESRNPR